MTVRAMPFRGSYTSREQVAVYDFSWPVALAIPAIAIFLQVFVPVGVRSMTVIDLPLMVTIFFAVSRRSPISGCLTGAVIGIVQDIFAGGPFHYLGMYGIAKTIVGFGASSIGLKIDVDNPGTRFLITYFFFVLHQGVYYGVAHSMLRQQLEWNWNRVALAALANAILALFIYHILDRFKQR